MLPQLDAGSALGNDLTQRGQQIPRRVRDATTIALPGGQRPRSAFGGGGGVGQRGGALGTAHGGVFGRLGR
jgi:hypothetical protein